MTPVLKVDMGNMEVYTSNASPYNRSDWRAHEAVLGSD